MIRPFPLPLLAPLLLATAALPLHAEALTTDRPDFVESSEVVGKGRFQIETSLAGDRDSAGGVRVARFATPTLLRLGIGDTVELRLESDGALRQRVEDTASGAATTTRGWADTSIGVKWHLQDGDAARGKASLAWLLHADLDTGSAPFRGQGVRPSLRMVAEWELASDWSVGVMPGVFGERHDQGARYWGGIAAATLGKSWNDRLRGFVEIAAQRIAHRRDGGSVVTADTGIAWLVSDDLQLDAAVAFGLNHDAPNFTWTTGLSVRF